MPVPDGGQPESQPQPGPTPGRIHTRSVVIFYLSMGAVAYGMGFWLAERNIFRHPGGESSSLTVDVLVGAGSGVLVVLLSRILERLFGWARRLAKAMRQMLGRFDGRDVLLWALCSALGEEMLFRGLLQPGLGLTLTSLMFGLLHIGPDRRYLPWTLMAVLMGFGFGLMFEYTGNLLAPIIAHFTINFFNLHALSTLEPASARPGPPREDD